MTTTIKRRTKAKLPSVIQYKDEDILEYEEKTRSFRQGDINDIDFMSFRVRIGVYGQRQADSQMIRIKIPGGLLHADQLDALGEITERLAPLKKGHLTTRENIQIHHLKLEEAAEAMRILQGVGLSTKEACGNTVRNVTACPLVGLDPQQAFDIQPYLGAYARRFVRRDFTHHMPRKIKTAFSCGDHDCAVTPMHDVGFIARTREENGHVRKGFKIVVGGGTSIQPLKAQTLYEFVPVEEFLKISEAALRVFNQTAWLRKNKMKARIKVLIHAEGIDSFREKVEEELRQDWAQDYPGVEDFLFEYDEQADAPELPADHLVGHEDDAAFQAWRETNVTPQREDGYNFVGVTVPQGDLTPDQFRALADIARSHAASTVRITAEQNLVYRWVPQGLLFEFHQALEAAGLGEDGMDRITDVTSCPGTDSCKLGITSSMGLNTAISNALKSPNGNTELLSDPLIQKIHVKMSGCPNGCGRHHVADIGFHGAAMKGAGGQQVPAYEVFLGGSYEGGDVRYGVRPRGRIPAKRVKDALFDILRYYQEHRDEGEAFKDFTARVGKEPFEGVIASFAEVPALGRDTIDLYMDYDKTVLYKVERGEGECAV